MDKVDIESLDKVVDFHRRGAKIWFGRSSSGRTKIKVKYGPFGLRTKRFQTNEATYDAIMAEIHKMTEASGH